MTQKVDLVRPNSIRNMTDEEWSRLSVSIDPIARKVYLEIDIPPMESAKFIKNDTQVSLYSNHEGFIKIPDTGMFFKLTLVQNSNKPQFFLDYLRTMDDN